jgi:hypothetical protein
MTSADDEFTQFADAASSRLMATAFLLCGDWHTAEDLTQTTLAKVFAAWWRIRNRDAVHAYARRTLLNTYLAHYRRPQRREVLIADVMQLPDQALEPRTPELKLALMDALATLPPSRQVSPGPRPSPSHRTARSPTSAAPRSSTGAPLARSFPFRRPASGSVRPYRSRARPSRS